MHDAILVSALGVVIEIDMASSEGAASDRLRESWAGSRLGAGGEPALTVRAHSDLPVDVMLKRLSSEIAAAAVEHCRGDQWILYGAGFANERGDVLAFVAPAGVASDGFGDLEFPYLRVSDGVLGFDSQGRVSHFRVSRPTEALLAASHGQMVSPFAPDVGLDRLRVSKFVVLEQSDDVRNGSSIDCVTLEDALSLLVAASPNICDFPSPLGTITSLLDATGGAIRVRYRDEAALSRVVDELMKSRSPDGVVSPEAAARAGLRARGSASGRVLYRCAAVDDQLLQDGKQAVLLRLDAGGHELRVLSALDAKIWDLADGVAIGSLVELVTTASEESERDEGTTSVQECVEATIAALEAMGLLVASPSWRIDSEVAWVSKEDRTTVMSLVDSDPTPIVLVDSSDAIWGVLAGNGPLNQEVLIDEVARHYSVEPTQIAEDVVNLLRELRILGVVTQA